MRAILIALLMTLATRDVALSLELKPYETYFKGDEVEIGEQIICEETEVIGFNWSNGGYIRKNYKENRYLFTKKEHRSNSSDSECHVLSPQHFKYECSCQSRLYGKRDWLLEDDEAEMTIGAVLNRCYTMNDEGIEYQLSCVEGYRAGKLKSIECDEHEIKFHPEQLFLRSPSPASRDVDMFPKDDYKDSFVIAHGKCRVLSY